MWLTTMRLPENVFFRLSKIPISICQKKKKKEKHQIQPCAHEQ